MKILLSKKSVYLKPDKLGIGLSGLCALHCLLMPAVLIGLPVSEMAPGWMHLALALVILPITLLAIRAEVRKGRNPPIISLLGLGLLLVIGGLWFGHAADGESMEKLLTLLGSGCLLAGHFRRLYCSH